jgi:Flp pilus assembly protein TadB
MTDVGLVLVSTMVGALGLVLVASGWFQPAPSLRRTIAHLRRVDPGVGCGVRRGRVVLQSVDRALARHPGSVVSDAQLMLIGRSREQHTLMLVLAAIAGFVIPGVLLGVLQRVGFPGGFVPAAGAVAGAVLGPVLVHLAAVERARTVRADLRYQVSAYLDVVTMLLAGNTGYESALEQGARAGDGRLFAELRRRVREAGARGASLTEALHRTGVELGLDELEQVAATAALSAAEGAPVARSLGAKCATLRSTLAAEEESEARLRTSRLTTPIVGMALIFMGLVIYPALSFS